MIIKRCFNYGGLVLKKRGNSKFCSSKCENENIEKQMQEDDTIDLWEDILVKLDLAGKEKSKESRIMRR